MVRLALAGVVLLSLGLSWALQDAAWAYLAALFAALLGLLATFRPGILRRSGAARAAADAFVVGVIVADTGGAASAFFPLYFPAALSLINAAGRAEDLDRARIEGVGGAAILVGGYLFATLAADGWEGPSSPTFALRMVILVLFCTSAVLVGVEVRALRGRAVELAATAAAERDRASRAATQTSALGPALRALGIELALDYVAVAACAVAGASYGHVASLKGNLHRTVVQGESDAYPSWWHPSVQRLVLWSCREGSAVRLGESVHGVEGFMAVPVGAGGREPGGEQWGAIVVGGGRGGPEVERDLLGLAADVRPALERGPDAAGGIDLPSGLPNAESLARVLRQGLSAGVPPVVFAVRLSGGASLLEGLMRRVGERLRGGGRRVFRCRDDILVILEKANGEVQAAEKARALLRVANEESRGSVGSRAETAVGFALPGTRAKDPDELVTTALLALDDASGKQVRIAGAVAGVREPSGAAIADASSPYVLGFVKAMVARDPYLADHSAGVSRAAGRIGRALSLDQEQLSTLTVGALLHDIGKIGIPDRILHKPGSLTDEEYVVIKRHPTIGAEIVTSIPELLPVLPAIRHHHERFDGLGYPDGLRAEETPLLARVVAVADAFDSMTRERPYGRRMSARASLEEIMRLAGTQFDPKVARALSQVALVPDSPRADDLAV